MKVETFYSRPPTTVRVRKARTGCGQEGWGSMDTWEFNKIAGAVLAALLLMFGTATFIHIQMSHKPGRAGYTLPVEITDAQGPAQPSAPAGVDVEKVKRLLQNASAENGQAAFKRGGTGRTNDKVVRNTAGPNLWRVDGRARASQEGVNYSSATKAEEGECTYEERAHFIHDPRGYTPGSEMAFAGLKDEAEIADLVA